MLAPRILLYLSLFLRFLLFQLLLQLDHPERQLLDFLLVDVREVLHVRVVELLDGLGQLCVDRDEFLEGLFEGEVLLVEVAVLLAKVVKVSGHVGVVVVLPEKGT